jgi:hypothetical protein
MRTAIKKIRPTITIHKKDLETRYYTLNTGDNKYLADRFRVEIPIKNYLQCKYVVVNDTGAIITGLRPVGKGIFRGDILRQTKTGSYKNSFLILIVNKKETSPSITILFYLNKKPRNPQNFARIESIYYLKGRYD